MSGPFETLIEMLEHRAEVSPGRGYRFLRDGEVTGAVESLSYSELWRQAQVLAAGLQREGAPGERVLLLFAPGVDFIVGFFGCLLAGAVPVPAFPPDPIQRQRSLDRICGIIHSCSAAFVLCGSGVDRDALGLDQHELPALRWLTIQSLMSAGSDAHWHRPRIRGEQLAFLQYTSGSTGRPLGVVISHANLVATQRMITEGLAHHQPTVVATWLPLFHDMGLIGTTFNPLWCGSDGVLMPPQAFLKRPLRWLEAISHFRATISGGPDFSYDLCVRRVRRGQAESLGSGRLDLSSWRVAFCGAEPVRQATLQAFSEAFRASGFSCQAFLPCYGLAEATLYVTGAPAAQQYRSLTVDSAALEADRVVPVAADHEHGINLVSCGRPSGPPSQVVIVDPRDRTGLGEGRVGEIWISGPHVALGYWNREALTAETFGCHLADQPDRGSFLRTGDLGFLSAGELFVTGRLKDLIILGGCNHYPQDIEATVERCHPRIRPGSCAAFSIELDGRERLAVLLKAEVKGLESDSRELLLDELVDAIVKGVARSHGVRTGFIGILKAGSIARTSSGKVARWSCRRMLRDGVLSMQRVWRDGHNANGLAHCEPE
jgi:acyl-CoA synthetase (AMP-forming)/AMP-acid ligase II